MNHTPFRMTREPVTQNRYSVDRTATIKMDLQLVCSGSIVHLGYVQRSVRTLIKQYAKCNAKRCKPYIPHIDWSVVCIHPLFRSHVVERPWNGNINWLHLRSVPLLPEITLDKKKFGIIFWNFRMRWIFFWNGFMGGVVVKTNKLTEGKRASDFYSFV